jgi:hypothetical protein
MLALDWEKSVHERLRYIDVPLEACSSSEIGFRGNHTIHSKDVFHGMETGFLVNRCSVGADFM